MAKNKKKEVKKTSYQNKITAICIAFGVLAAAIIFFVAYLAISDNKEDAHLTSATDKVITENENSSKGNNTTEEKEKSSMETVKVLVEMENGDDFTLELYPEYAPKTVENFVKLVGEGFYDGLTFHRIVDGFMAQGGDPEGTGMGGSNETITGEFASNGFKDNTLSHTRGVISMARSMDPDSASSQFFICYDNASFLDGQYAAFGEVIDGMETVDAFLEVERAMNEMGEIATPKTPVRMKHLSVIE